jgi:hypothetical protein
VWEELPQTSTNTHDKSKSMLYVLDNFGEIKYRPTLEMFGSSPTKAVLHDTFFACIFPYPVKALRYFSFVDDKWINWTHRVTRYGKTSLTIDDDVFILSKQKDDSIILKANIDGVFERF